MNTAEYLIKKLEELGVKDFFGLPGDYNFNILYAIENNPDVNWIGCTNELNAAYAADGYARQKGFGALVTTYGVGELSALNAIAGSYAENVPVIHIVGVPVSKSIQDKKLVHHNFQTPRYNTYQEVFKNVCETTAFLNRDNAKIEIDRIISMFIKERKPVYVAIPADIAQMNISTKETNYEWNSDSETLQVVVEKIYKKIINSKNPVILADILIERFAAQKEFINFVDNSGIPSTSFLMGSVIVPSDNYNYVGSYFGKYLNPKAYSLVQNTDCLIAVGTIYSDFNSYGLDLPYKINTHIGIYGTYTYIEGVRYDNIKMSDVLKNLSEIITKRDFDTKKDYFGYQKLEATYNKLTSNYIYSRLQEYLKEGDILVAETGTIPLGISQINFPKNSKLHTQALWSSIGWATPATLGISVATPNSRVILFTGDGSHLVSAMEIGTMLRYKLKPVILVLNNRGYTNERLLSREPNDFFNNILEVNYSKFVRAFEKDIWATRVKTEDELDRALRVTQVINKLCYIEILIEEMDVLELSQRVSEDFRQNIEKEIKDAPKESVLINPEVKISNKDKNINFETTVHASLNIIGE